MDADSKKITTLDETRPTEPAPNEEGTLVWTVHPGRRKLKTAIAVALFVVTIVALIFLVTSSLWMTLLALVILYASLAKFYFPTKYTLSESGIVIKTTTQTLQKEWSLYRSCYADKNGILLSPFVEPSRLENFRGLFVMFDGNRDEVTAFVKDQIKRAHSSPVEDDLDPSASATGEGDNQA